MLEYWRDFIRASVAAVIRRGDILRYHALNRALMAAALKIQLQYERLLARELSR